MVWVRRSSQLAVLGSSLRRASLRRATSPTAVRTPVINLHKRCELGKLESSEKMPPWQQDNQPLEVQMQELEQEERQRIEGRKKRRPGFKERLTRNSVRMEPEKGFERPEAFVPLPGEITISKNDLVCHLGRKGNESNI